MNSETTWQDICWWLLAVLAFIGTGISMFLWAIVSGLSSWLSAPFRWLRLAVTEMLQDEERRDERFYV